MEENLFLLISLLYLLVVLYLLDFVNNNQAGFASESETHARTRYSMAEKIQKETEG